MGPVARCYYMTLLAQQWQEGSIPSDRTEVERLLIMPSDYQEEGYVNGAGPKAIDLKATIDKVLACFEPNGKGGLVNKRMEVIRRYHNNIRKAKSEGGKNGRMRQIQSKPGHTPGIPRTKNGDTPGNQNQIQNQNQKKLFSLLRKERTREEALAQKRRALSCTEWVPEDSWRVYVEM